MFEPLPGERFMYKPKTETKYQHAHAICIVSKVTRGGCATLTIKGTRLDGRRVYVTMANAEKPPTIRSN